MARELTAKQRKYAERRAAGDSYADAYNAAYDDHGGTRKTAATNAENLEKRSAAAPAIMARIAELRAAAERGAILKREERQALLTEIATNEGETTRDRIRALDQLNRMSGDYTENTRVTLSGGVTMTYAERLEAIRAELSGEL